MAKAGQTNKETLRKGRFSWFALVLLLVSVIGFIFALLPKTVSAMWKRTAADLQKKESVFSFADKVLRGGTVTIAGEGEGANSAEAIFALPDKASLSVTGADNFLISLAEDAVTVERNGETSSASASWALAAFDKSYLAEEKSDLAYSLRRFLLLAEQRKSFSEVLDPYLKTVRSRMPREVREKVEGEDGSELLISYEFDAKRLAAILAEWQKTLPGDTDLRLCVTDLVRAVYAFAGESAPQETVDRIDGFLSGADGRQALLAAGLSGGKGSLKWIYRAVNNKIRGVTVIWELPFGDAVSKGEFALDFGRDPGKSKLHTLSVTEKLTRGTGEETFSLILRDEVAKDDKAGYIREISLTAADPASRILPEAASEGGAHYLHLVYSLGRANAPTLGLLVETGGRTVRIGGELIEYKAGKQLEFRITRVAVEGRNIIDKQSYVVTVRTGGEPASLIPSKMTLFLPPETDRTPSGENGL